MKIGNISETRGVQYENDMRQFFNIRISRYFSVRIHSYHECRRFFSAGMVKAADLSIYGDALAPGWENWSWNTTTDFGNIQPIRSGAQSLSAIYISAWAGLYLATNSSIDSGGYDTLVFWIYGGPPGGQRLRVMLADGGDNLIEPGVNVSVAGGVWTKVAVTLNDLGNPAQIAGIVWQDITGGSQPIFYLDDIVFTYNSNNPPTDPLTGPDLTIDADNGRHQISEDIYGVNFADEQLAADLRLPVRRFGGNAATRYNWQTSMTNTGSDWYFENLQSGDVNVSTLPYGSASDQFVEQDRRTGTKTILTDPIIGWTVKSSSPRNHPYDCGFKVSTYGPQQSVDPWDTNCGNGIYPNGSIITGNDPRDTSMEIGPEFVEAWIDHLTFRYGYAEDGGVAYYNLDNEPMLWNSTHRDIHPKASTYDELRDQTYQYAAAVKTADPSAKTLGPALWGWCAYFYSASDGCGIGPDYQSHGNMPFVVWYLQQMKDYEQTHGVRILDFLDLHYYPQASGVALSSAGSSSTQALRLRSTRSLWDSSYVDESWISDTQINGVAVRLIPRMRDWVNTNYPGTKLAITEYNWGGLESINGALTQADVLGIFGREGLDLATLWGPPAANQPGAYAFRIYRNYDGNGEGFGDVSVQAKSNDQDTLAVYAAQKSQDEALTIIVINKTGSDLASSVHLTGYSPSSMAEVYRYSAVNSGAIVRLENQTVDENGFSATFASKSITLFVIAPGTNAAQILSITKAGTGSGGITADSGSIIWSGNIGTATYLTGASVVLTAAANTGSAFEGWAGCDTINGSQCSVNMSGTRNVTAYFSLNRYTITANASGNGSGSVSSNVGGINYSYPTASSSSAILDYGTSVTLTADATNRSTVSWAGDYDSVAGTGQKSTCTIASINAAKSVTATFSAAPVCAYSLSPVSKTFTASGGKSSVNVTASSAGCKWTAASQASWITLTSGSSGTGSKIVKYSVARNKAGRTRTGTMAIAGQTFTVIQTK